MINLQSQQIHSPQLFRIGSIIVPLPAHKTAGRLSCVLYTVSLTGGLIPQTPWARFAPKPFELGLGGVHSIHDTSVRARRQRHALRRAPAGAFNTGGAAPSNTPAAPGLVCLCPSSRCLRQRHALRRAPAGAFSNTAPFVLATLTEIPSLVDSGCQRGKVSCFLPLEDIRIFLMFAV